MFRYPRDGPFGPTTRFFPRRDVTVLLTQQDILTDTPTAQIQLPFTTETNFTVVVTALVDSAFIPIEATHTLITDVNGVATIPLPEQTRYFKLEVQYQQGGQRVEVHCYSNIDEKGIWQDSTDLLLRAALLRANRFAGDTTGFDHGPNGGDQLGPCKAARAMAIVHLAIFEAVNSITPVAASAFNITAVSSTASREAAIAQALHDTLYHLFPKQRTTIDAELVAQLSTIAAGASKTAGIAAGAVAAERILFLRSTDGAAQVAVEETYDEYVARVYGEDPIPLGDWTQDPVSQFNVALGSRWSTVKPFVLSSADQFRSPAPPALDSQQFADNFNETKALGGDGVTTSTVRSDEHTFVGYFWAYDGTPSLCAPPRMYNQITSQLATEHALSALQFARLLAMVNTGMADTAIAAWEGKYYHKFWRPVTGIREIGVTNPYVVEDATWTPLGAPNSNEGGVDFTPPFPTLPSGHATFGGTVFQILRHFLGGDNIPFTFVSDEYNGQTTDSQGVARTLKPRSFTTLSQAEEENGQSRVYLGIHWAMDKVDGIEMGNHIGDWILDHLYLEL